MQSSGSAADVAPAMPYAYSSLPVGQLESLRSKINQMIDSIQTLQRTVEAGHQNAMPAWPDILSKYTMLLSQSHNLSMSLVGTYSGLLGSGSKSSANGISGIASSSQPATGNTNPYERLALHPTMAMTDAQLDNDLIPLLRNQQTTDVLKLENETVRHLAEHMATRGSLGVLSIPSSQPSTTNGAPPTRRPGFDASRKFEYTDVLKECDEIRIEHDERVDRAVRAVALLREKYDWKARVEVDQEEPEELEWDPRFAGQAVVEDDEMNVDTVADDREGSTSEEEEELEEVLGNGADQTPEATPEPQSPMAVG